MPTTEPAALELLTAGIEQARRLGRDDLVARLESERRQLTGGDWQVLVAGEFKKGKSAFVEGIVGLPICGSDPVRFTTVPTFVRYAAEPSAALVTGDERRDVPLRSAGEHATASGGQPVERIEVGLPREALRRGLVLVDAPGLGGGFGAAQAATTMRAMPFAQAVVVVTDASQELTAAEVEFLRHAATMCDELLCVLTKTDLYAAWPRILRINEGHLRDAGLDVDILPVSAAVRERALLAGDQRLNRESGFPAVLRRIEQRMRLHRTAIAGVRATAAVQSSMRQLASTLEAEQAALTVAAVPAERAAVVGRLKQRQDRLQRLAAPGARWLNTVNDAFVAIRFDVDDDLKVRIRDLGEEAKARVAGCDPQEDWAGIVRWLYKRTNEELLDSYRQMLTRIDEIAAVVAKAFDDDIVADLGAVVGDTRPPTAGEKFKVGQLASKKVSKLEVGMQAVRGWSLGSVVTSFVATMLNPGLVVVLPVLLVVGGILGGKAAWQYRQARLDAARAEAAQVLGAYLRDAHTDAGRVAHTVLHQCQSGIRDYYLDRAVELQTTALQEHAAAVQATRHEAAGSAHRAGQAAAELARVRALLAATEQATGQATAHATGQAAGQVAR